MALRGAGHRELTGDVELGTVVFEAGREAGGTEPHARGGVGRRSRRVRPRVQLLCGVEELLRPGVSLALRKKPAAAEVFAGEGVQEVTTFQAARPPERWSSGGELPGHFERFVEVELIVPVRPNVR